MRLSKVIFIFPVFGYDHAKANFVVTHSSTPAPYMDVNGPPESVNIRILYPEGAVTAYNVVSVTAGDEVGEYYLHTANGETYRIDDTIPAYLV